LQRLKENLPDGSLIVDCLYRIDVFELQTVEEFNSKDYDQDYLDSFNYVETGKEGVCHRKKLAVNEIESIEADYYGTAIDEARIAVLFTKFYAQRIISSVRNYYL
jgi:hypothetical protein